MWTLKERAKYWTPERRIAQGKRMKEIWDAKMASGFKFSESRNQKISEQTTGKPKTLTSEQKEANADLHRGNKYHWKGGRKYSQKGYIRVHVGTIDGISQYRYEQRKLVEDAYGELPSGMVVHHINGVKDDNRLDNLQAMTKREHLLLHLHGKEEQDVRRENGETSVVE